MELTLFSLRRTYSESISMDLFTNHPMKPASKWEERSWIAAFIQTERFAQECADRLNPGEQKTLPNPSGVYVGPEMKSVPLPPVLRSQWEGVDE